MNKIVKNLCTQCKFFKEITQKTDVFPYDIRKCTKYVNTIFNQPELSKETTVFYHTTFIVRYRNDMCGSDGKFFSDINLKQIK